MILTIICLIIAFISKAICDVLKSRYNTSIFKNLNPKYFNPDVSWKNKYKNGDPKQGEKFFGSTTFLVAWTDFWHLINATMVISFILSLTLCCFYVPFVNIFVDTILIFCLYGVVFELFFSKLLIKK